MNIFQINKSSAPLVVKLTNEIKPDWWTATDVIGWYMAEKQEEPIGWMCIKRLFNLPDLFPIVTETSSME